MVFSTITVPNTNTKQTGSNPTTQHVSSVNFRLASRGRGMRLVLLWLSSSSPGPYSVAVRISADTSGLSLLRRIRAACRAVYKTQSPLRCILVRSCDTDLPLLHSTVVQMGGSTLNISPGRDLLDLHGRVAIVTGAKYDISPSQWRFLCVG